MYCTTKWCRGVELNYRHHDFPLFHIVSYMIGLYLHPRIKQGAGRYLEGYCWDSLPSLYTFLATLALRDLARDYHICRTDFRLPRVHPVYCLPLLVSGPKIQSCALPLSYPGTLLICWTIPCVHPMIV